MRTVPLYPYAVSEALRLRLSEFDDPVEGVVIPVREVGANAGEGEDETLPAGTEYDVSGHRTWKKLTFKLEVSLAEGEVGRVLPATSDLGADTAAIVLISCPSTRFRHGVRLRLGRDGRWRGHATLQRDDVSGTVDLRPQLVRTTAIPDGDALPFASRAAAFVAFGEPASLYIDVSPKAGVSSFVSIEWEDFSNSEDPWRREHPDDVYHLEPFGVNPRLWLNHRYGQLRDVLESTAKRGPEALLRDMAAVLIAQPVMVQLCAVALPSLEIDEDSGSASLPGGWRSDLIEAILPGLYPEESSDEQRLKRAAQECRDGEAAASLMARVGTVVQRMLSTYDVVEAAVRTFESGRDGKETADD